MTENDLFHKLESNVRSYSNAFPAVFDVARGSEIWDSNGRRYLDFLAGCGSLNYGHNNPLFRRALIEYIERDGIAHSLDLHTSAKQRFLEIFNRRILQPRELDYVVQFPGPTGTNAVEAALKIARKISGRSNVISFTNGFHGATAGALAATGSRYMRSAAGMPLTGVTPMPYDGYLGGDQSTVDYLEKVIVDQSSGVDLPAAVIVEVVQGEGGINVASDGWLKQLRELCTAHNILMIVDDIQAGCGRTGTFFSFEKSSVTPDIVTLSKSLSGYGLPFAVTLMKRSLDVWQPGEHNGTFRGNNHAFVTAATAIENYWSTEEFSAQVETKGAHLGQRLQDLARQYSPDVVESRGRGLMRGLAFESTANAAAVSADAFGRGLILERSGARDEVLKFLPPLTVSPSEMDEALDIVDASIGSVLGMSPLSKNIRPAVPEALVASV